jgi:hypothetical protein
MAKTFDERLEAARFDKEQAEARIKKLIQEQKSQERKERNHRLCKRGGLVEKLLPDLAKLTDEQFDTFVEKTLLSGYTAKVIKELLPPEPAAAPDGAIAEKPAVSDAATATIPVSKAPQAANTGANSASRKPAETVRAAS